MTNSRELPNLLTKSDAKRVNKTLDRLEMEPVSNGVEAQLAAAAWKSHDAGLRHSFIAATFAGLALVVAIANSHVGETAVPRLAALMVFLFVAGTFLVLQERRNWEAARAVLDYRIEHDLLPADTADDE